MATTFWIALGSAVGGAARYGVGLWTAARFGDAFPWGTLIVNVVGSFVIGLAMSPAWPLSNDARLFITVGLCGGFTTFSAFSIQTLTLMQAGQWGAVAFNVAGSVVLCLVAASAGVFAGGALR
ncbi:MAG: fluoride efflux transporter CrcB [Alphaproteobacteria bacterium]|nr:fluoride efflux transporter CrcB [Alphaproteobacteria bacterium]